MYIIKSILNAPNIPVIFNYFSTFDRSVSKRQKDTCIFKEKKKKKKSNEKIFLLFFFGNPFVV